MGDKSIKVFAPATIANVGPGFDIFGLALEGIGDTVTMRLTQSNAIEIVNGAGCEGLPVNPEQNVAGGAALALLKALDKSQGVHLTIEKNIQPGSGMGSSASSAVAAVVGLNHLLGSPFSARELIPFAMEGERVASDVPHADNVAPCLLGGFTVVRSYDPLDVFQIPVKMNLWFTIIHPHLEVKTSDSKKMLKKEISLKQGIQQWGNVAGVVTALLTNDPQLLSRSMQDPLVEPVRSILIPGFDAARDAALKAGGLASSISGSGPSIFVISETRECAERVKEALASVYQQFQIDHEIYISPLNSKGAIVLP